MQVSGQMANNQKRPFVGLFVYLFCLLAGRLLGSQSDLEEQ